MKKQLAGSTALVTGASSGIGAEFARQLARAGCNVILTGRDASALGSVRSTLSPGQHSTVEADLSQAEGVDRTAALCEEKRPQILINNAGVGLYGRYDGAPWGRLQEMMHVNCVAVAKLAHAFLLVAQPSDALVNVSSIAAFLPQPTSAMYCGTKAFVTALSEALWYENKARGVYVMGLHPGITRTNFRVRAGGEALYPASAQDTEVVVRVAMRHLVLRREPTVTCGPLNMLLSMLPRFFSRRAIVQYLGNSRSYEP